MHAKAKIGKFLVAAALLTWLPAGAQSPTGSSPPMQGSVQVSMVVFQVRSNPDGSQMVVARDGSLVPLPPPGVAASATEVPVYADTAGHYWYQSQSGEAVPIYDTRLTWSQSSPPAQTQSQPDSQKKGRRGGGVLGTALGAAAGAALGTAMVSSQYGVPYGTPVYPGNPGSLYYVGPNGYPVYVNPANASALYSQYAVQQQVVQTNRLNYQNSAQQSALQFQQEAYQNSLNYQQQRQAQYQANQAARQAAAQPVMQPVTQPVTQPVPSQAAGQAQMPAQLGNQTGEAGRFGRRGGQVEGAGEAAQAGRFGRRGGQGEGAGEAAQAGRFGRRGSRGDGPASGAGLQSSRNERRAFGGARTEGAGKGRRGAQAGREARSFDGNGSRNKGGRHRGR